MENEELQREKHFKRKARRKKLTINVALTVICIILGIALSLVYKDVMEEKKLQNEQFASISDYQAHIIELSSEVEALTKTKEDLEKKLDVYENGTNDETLKALQDENTMLKKFACLTDVVGKGVVITLNYDNPDSIVASSANIQSLLNELKASTAQAISINGERIISMSEVRAVSDRLVINGNSYYGPYTISVIGNATSIESSLSVSILPKFEAFFKTYGGSIKCVYEDNISIAAYNEELIQNQTDMMFDN